MNHMKSKSSKEMNHKPQSLGKTKHIKLQGLGAKTQQLEGGGEGSAHERN